MSKGLWEHMAEANKVTHTLSPSAWNRYEACPRQYWLSRQGLPRKAGMAASLGTAVHASIEDLLQLDLSNRSPEDTGWLDKEATNCLEARWNEEKQIFMGTPRRPKWKEAEFSKAVKQQKGAIEMLLKFIKAPLLPLEKITIKTWRQLLSRVIAVEGELRTSDDRLMGRLDMLLADVDEKGNLHAWVVADLKTGRPPEKELKPEVKRQLLLYRDILLSNNPNAPTVRTEGWYTANAHMYVAEGQPVIDQALEAWEATIPTQTPLPPTPGKQSCGGFCDWKAWCPHWWTWKQNTNYISDFNDIVILLHSYDSITGSSVVEICEPANPEGRVMPTGNRVSLNFDDRGKEALEELLSTNYKGPIFISSVMSKKNIWRAGHWCDVLPWSPIPDA